MQRNGDIFSWNRKFWELQILTPSQASTKSLVSRSETLSRNATQQECGTYCHLETIPAGETAMQIEWCTVALFVLKTASLFTTRGWNLTCSYVSTWADSLKGHQAEHWLSTETFIPLHCLQPFLCSLCNFMLFATYSLPLENCLPSLGLTRSKTGWTLSFP